MARIFISYRRDDSAYVAAAINERFQQRFGETSVFFDIDTIPLGIDFREHIGDEIGQCDVLIVVIGDKWVSATNADGEQRLFQTTDYVRVEIESALERNVPVIPVMVDNAVMPAESELPESIRDLVFRNAGEVRAGRNLSDHLERLIHDVEQLLGIDGADNASSRDPRRPRHEKAAGTTTTDGPSGGNRIVYGILAVLMIAAIGVIFAVLSNPAAEDKPVTVALPPGLRDLPAGAVLNVLVNGERPEVREAVDGLQLRLLIQTRRDTDTAFKSLVDGDSVASLNDEVLMFVQPLSSGYLYVFQIDSSGQVAWFFPRNESDYSAGTNPVVADKVIQIPPPNAQGETEAFFLDEQTGIEHVYAVLCAEPWPALRNALGQAVERSASVPPTSLAEIERPFSLANLAPQSRGIGGKVVVESPTRAPAVHVEQQGRRLTIPLIGHLRATEGSVLIIERWYQHVSK